MGDQGHELLWMDPADEKEDGKDELVLDTETEGDRVRKLEEVLAGVRKELSDVRRELAAKTIQLSKREAKAEEESRKKAEPKEAEVDVSALHLEIETLHSEIVKMHEVIEDAERTKSAQEKALQQATSASEAAMATAAGEEAARLSLEAQAEHELEKAHRELAALKNRTNMQLQQKDAGLAALEARVASAQEAQNRAVREAEERCNSTFDSQLSQAKAEAREAQRELEARIVNLQAALDEGQTMDNTEILEELGAAQAERAAMQREFESFREMAGSAAREKTGEISRLMEENAGLRARLARSAANSSTLGKFYDTEDESNQLRLYVERILNRRAGSMFGHQSVVCLVVFGIIASLLLFAVLRAMISARGPNRWLCVMEKLGLVFGDGCLGLNHGHIEELIDEIIEHHPRTRHMLM